MRIATVFLLPLSVLLCLGSCQSDSGTARPPANPGTVSSDSLPKAAPPETKQRLRLAFVGDIMGHGDQIKSAYNPETKTYNYEPCFRFIRPVLEESDLAIGNLELTLNNRGQYTGYPRFRSPDTLAHFVKGAGFDFLVTANNHSNDDDLRGVVHTLDVLDAVQLPHTGTFRNAAERESTYPYMLRHKKGNTEFVLAVLNFTYGTNGIPTQAPAVVNLIDTAQILADIAKAKAAKPDMIIALAHWGSEYQLNERTEQRTLTQLLWRNGVDLVIGAHPHVIQPIKTDTVDGRPVLVAYSLGNFISNQFQKNTDIGLVVEVDLEKDNATNTTRIVDCHYIPAWRYIHNKGAGPHGRTHTVLPSAAFEGKDNPLKLSEATLRDMKATTDRMREHLNKWGAKERRPKLDWNALDTKWK